MRTDSITGKMIWKEIRTMLGLGLWLIAWLLNIPSTIILAISNIIKNKDDEFPKL